MTYVSIVLPWAGVQVLSRKVSYTLAQWSIMLKEVKRGKPLEVVSMLEALARAPPLLLWPDLG
jgi:hypothetical protein